MKNYLAARITGLCSIAAGLLHVSIVAQQHWTPFPPLEGMFFMVGGIMQIVLGVHFFRQPKMRTYRLGLAMNGGMAILCLIMLYLPVPFVGESEAMGSLALIVVTLELIAVGTSLRWLHTHEHHGNGRKLHATLVGTLGVVLFWGAGFYGGAQGAALLMPNRSVGHAHTNKEEHLPPRVVETGDPHGTEEAQNHDPDYDDHHEDDNGH